MFNKKYIIVKVIKEQNSYSIVKAISINPSKPMYKGNRIDTENPTVSKRLKVYFYVDSDGNQLTFNSKAITNNDTKIVDDMLNGKVMSELTKDMTGKNFKQKLYDMIIGALIGGLTTFIVSAFVFGGFTI